MSLVIFAVAAVATAILFALVGDLIAATAEATMLAIGLTLLSRRRLGRPEQRGGQPAPVAPTFGRLLLASVVSAAVGSALLAVIWTTHGWVERPAPGGEVAMSAGAANVHTIGVIVVVTIVALTAVGVTLRRPPPYDKDGDRS